MMMALITNKNKPNVSMVIGNVKTINMGFTVTLKIPNTTATIIALIKLVTSTPGKKYESTITAKAVNNILNNNFILLCFNFL